MKKVTDKNKRDAIGCFNIIETFRAEEGGSIVSSNAPLQLALCRFEVKGQRCVIVEDGLMPSSDLKDPGVIISPRYFLKRPFSVVVVWYEAIAKMAPTIHWLE